MSSDKEENSTEHVEIEYTVLFCFFVQKLEFLKFVASLYHKKLCKRV